MKVNHKIKLVTWLAASIICVSLILDFTFTTYFTKTATVATSNKIYRLTDQNHLNEITIFGSSRAEKAYYCDSINANCYNYGFPNQNFEVSALLLEFELKKEKNTPIIIDIHHDYFQHDAYTNINLATYLPFVNSNTTVTNFLNTNNRLLPYHYVPGARYFGSYSSYIEPLVGNKLGLGNAHYLKGGIFDTKIGASRSIEKRIANRKSKSLTFEIPAEKDSLLRSLITAHTNRNFIFVISPYHYSAKSTITNWETMLSYFTMLETKYPNVIFIDLSSLLTDDKYFKDTVHLNESGAQVFSLALRLSLIETGLF